MQYRSRCCARISFQKRCRNFSKSALQKKPVSNPQISLQIRSYLTFLNSPRNRPKNADKRHRAYNKHCHRVSRSRQCLEWQQQQHFTSAARALLPTTAPFVLELPSLACPVSRFLGAQTSFFAAGIRLFDSYYPSVASSR